MVKAKWDDYLRLKQVAKDLVKEKMEKERAEILKEMKAGGGLTVVSFGVELSVRRRRE